MGSLAGKRALVTAGAQGIGLAISEALIAEGCHVVAHYYSSSEGAADSPTREALGLDEGARVLIIEKTFREDESPVMLTVNRIPARIVSDAEYKSDEAMPVYEFLEDHCDRTLGYYLSEIIPVALDADTAEKLGVEPGTLAISFDEIGFDQNNEPIVRATSYFRDDLLRFRLIRRRSGA